MHDPRAQIFRGYDENYLQFGEQRLTHSFSVHEGEVSPWTPASLSEVKAADLSLFMDNPPEVLLIGTGRRTAFPGPDVMQALDDARIGFEFMDSRAAARTYNILVEEGREVSLAILLPSAR